jgi:hypothetical protein
MGFVPPKCSKNFLSQYFPIYLVNKLCKSLAYGTLRCPCSFIYLIICVMIVLDLSTFEDGTFYTRCTFRLTKGAEINLKKKFLAEKQELREL